MERQIQPHGVLQSCQALENFCLVEWNLADIFKLLSLNTRAIPSFVIFDVSCLYSFSHTVMCYVLCKGINGNCEDGTSVILTMWLIGQLLKHYVWSWVAPNINSYNTSNYFLIVFYVKISNFSALFGRHHSTQHTNSATHDHPHLNHVILKFNWILMTGTVMLIQFCLFVCSWF